MTTGELALRRAKESYIFLNGKAYTFSDSTWLGPEQLPSLALCPGNGEGHCRLRDLLHGPLIDKELTQPFEPVLAIGSNGSPEQLARKFSSYAAGSDVLIPVIRAVLEDFDVVYAPLLASYGSCPATLEESPGTAVQLSVTYLSQSLLEFMHATEGSYSLVRLRNINLHVGTNLQSFRAGMTENAYRNSSSTVLTQILQYNHQCGALLPINVKNLQNVIALKEIPCTGRRYPELGQSRMLLFLQDYIAFLGTSQRDGYLLDACPDFQDYVDGATKLREENGRGKGMSLDAWILEVIDDDDLRICWNKLLARHVKSFQYQPVEVVKVLGTRHLGAP